MFERPQLSGRLSTAAGCRYCPSDGKGPSGWWSESQAGLNEATRVEMVVVAEHLKLTSPENQGVHRWIGESY